MKNQTKAIQTSFPRKDAYNSISMPVYHSASFDFPNAKAMSDAFCGITADPDYSRITNPTVIHFENVVKELTGAHDVVAYSSGMGAISNVLMTLCAAGKNIVTSGHVFGNTYLVMTKTLKRFGVETRLIDLLDAEAVERSIDENTALLYLEAVTNPQMEVADLKVLSEIAHRHGVPMVVDTTMIPFTQYDGRALGIDIEVVSSTKYISGGATSLGGLVIDYGNIEGFSDMLRKELLINLGGYMTPHQAYMQTLGLENLEARYRIQEHNARYLAEHLLGVPGVEKVTYPGLKSDKFHEAFVSQYGDRAGAMLTIDLEDQEACFRFLDKLQVVRRSTNLFDNKSLAIHPASTIFGTLTPEERKSMDVLDTTIRFSAGLEDAEDLLADILQALK